MEQIRKFKDFIELNYKTELLKNVRQGLKFLVIDFTELSKFDPELAEILLDEPEETIKAAELALEEFDLTDFKIRFRNLPENQHVMIRDIRSKHLGKFIQIEGVVKQKSDVRPQVTTAKFECPRCGNQMNILQVTTTFREPTNCSCGRKGKFRLIGKELIDAQKIVLEEAPESLEGGEQPKRISVLLKGDLVSPVSEKKTNPGNKIRVIGIIKEMPIVIKGTTKSTRYDLFIEGNYVEPIEETFYDVAVTEEEEAVIKEMANDPKIYRKLVNSIAPSIFGYKEIKEALVLQLMGGVRKVRKDGVVSRGDIHILLVGDPGCGKSALLKRVNVIAPKSRYVAGKGVSAAGLTATVVRDEFLKGWALEAGALVLASEGICCIDEIDKISSEDRAAMHEALENQTVSISKANIQATLIARTTVLGAANPKFGRFDPYDILANQIDLPPTLINRFDLIFPIQDIPEEKKDKELAEHILHLHKEPDAKKPEIETRLLKKYFAYGRQKIKPVLTEGALQEIKHYYIKMRSLATTEEGTLKTIPISARQLEALVRLAEASAKTRLYEKVTRKDARKAIELLEYCLRTVGMDKETGKIDIDRIATGIPTSQRTQIATIREIIAELEERLGKEIPIEDIIMEAEERGIEKERVEEIIEKLKRTGDIFEPRHGLISRL